MAHMDISFGPNGERIVETFGIDGPGCKDASKFLEDVLGTVVEVTKKPEFYNEGGRVEIYQSVRDENKICEC